MQVHHVMKKVKHAVAPETKLRDLWKTIFKKKVHTLPVVDKQLRMLGMVSEEDLLKPLYPNYREVVEDFVSASDFEDMEEQVHDLVKLKAKDLMNTSIIFTRTDTPIMRALARMISQNVSQLPVLSDKNILIGIITKGDIFDALFKRHLNLKGFDKNKERSLIEHKAKKKKKYSGQHIK